MSKQKSKLQRQLTASHLLSWAASSSLSSSAFSQTRFPHCPLKATHREKRLKLVDIRAQFKIQVQLDCLWLIATYLVMTISRQITTGLSAILTISQRLHVTVVKCIVKFSYQSLCVPSRQPRRVTTSLPEKRRPEIRLCPQARRLRDC